jgi:hypothetical protein
MRLIVLELGFCIVLIYLLVQVVVHLVLVRCNRVFYSLIHIHLLVYVGVVVLVLLDLLLRETVVVYRSLKMLVCFRDILRFDWLLLLKLFVLLGWRLGLLSGFYIANAVGAECQTVALREQFLRLEFLGQKLVVCKVCFVL